MDLELEKLFLDEFGPEKVLILRDTTANMLGFLVIDNSLYGIPLGGVRIAEDLTLKEVIRLGRSMTLKACTFKIPIGGAKAGIVANPNSKEKDILLGSFAEAIHSFIKEDMFFPEPGLGSKVEDIDHIFKISGHPELMPRRVGIFKYDIPLKKKYVGFGVSHCLETLFSEEIDYVKQLGIQWNEQPKILLEGFGRTGREIGKQLIKRKYQLNGISTIKGAIFDEDGLDIEKLIDLKEKYGDDLVSHYDSKNFITLDREKLFELSSEYSIDFIIPGARPDSINKNNLEKIKPKAIVPASNCPYEDGIIEDLENEGILAFPDFVSNAGDILALTSRQRNKANVKVGEHIKNKIISKTHELIEEASKEKISLYSFARNKALEDLKKKRSRREKHVEKLDETIKKRKHD
jgi:glutamate dehydrogenase (NAD(P)+)